MKFHHIGRLDALSVALFIATFEFFALSFLPFLGYDSVTAGVVDGFFSAFLAVLFFNFLSLKGWKVVFWLDKKKKGLERLDLVVSCLANGVFLAFLFSSQNFVTFGFVGNQVLRDALSGFVNTFVAMVFCIILFNLLSKFIGLRFGIVVDGKKIGIVSIGLGSAFFVGLFELFILPFMGLFFVLFASLPGFLSFPLVGLLAGFIGSFFASFVYNFFAKRFKGISVGVE